MKYFFCEHHRLEYRDRQVVCKFQGRVIFLKRDIQPRGICMTLYFFQKKLYLQVCKFEKKILPVRKYFFGKYHRLEYCDR